MHRAGASGGRRLAPWVAAVAIHAALLCIVVPARRPAPPRGVTVELVPPQAPASSGSAASSPAASAEPDAAPRLAPAVAPPPLASSEAPAPSDLPLDAGPQAVAPAPAAPASEASAPDPAVEATRRAVREALARGPAAQRERALLLASGGSGPVTGDALAARVSGLIELDAQRINEGGRAARGVAHPVVGEIQSAMHREADLTLQEMATWGLPGEMRMEQGLPEHMTHMLELATDAGAKAGLAATACPYHYTSLGTYSLLITAAGEIVDIAVYASSGSPALDASMMARLRRMSPLPALPPEALGPDGLFRGTWELGFRDQKGSPCKVPTRDGEPYHATVIAWRGALY